jgi:hypothetical protein
VRQIEGVAGIHIMTVSWEAAIPEILKRAHLLPEERGIAQAAGQPAKSTPAAT